MKTVDLIVHSLEWECPACYAWNQVGKVPTSKQVHCQCGTTYHIGKIYLTELTPNRAFGDYLVKRVLAGINPSI